MTARLIRFLVRLHADETAEVPIGPMLLIVSLPETQSGC